LIKLRLKSRLLLNLCIIGALTLPAFEAAMAQSRAVHEMKRIRSNIEYAQIDVPEIVVGQIEDILIEIKVIDDIKDTQHQQHVYRGVTGPEIYLENISELKRREEEYYTSSAYIDLHQQEVELYLKAQALMLPYLEEDLSLRVAYVKLADQPPPDTREGRIKRRINLYKKQYEYFGEPISEVDLRELKFITEEMLDPEEQVRVLMRRRKVGSPEFKHLQQKLKELRRRERLILSPYDKAYKRKQRAKQRLKSELAPRGKRLTSGEISRQRLERSKERYSDIKAAKQFKSETKKYTRYGLTISDADAFKLKDLYKESLKLQAASDKKFGKGKKPPEVINSAEYQKDLARRKQVRSRQEKVLKIYDDKLTALLK